MTSSEKSLRATRKRGLTVRELDDEVLIYDPETTRASCLNAFAAEVLMRCDGQRTSAEIAQDLPFDDVDDRLVILALADLQKAQLLEAHGTIDTAALIGSSRRAFLKRIAVGTAVAVPVVTGLRMPAAAQAATGEQCTFGSCGPFLKCVPQTPADKNCEQPGNDCRCEPI